MFRVIKVRVAIALVAMLVWCLAEMFTPNESTAAVAANPEAKSPVRVLVTAFPGMYDYTHEEHACLARVIYVEARGESNEGQKLVAYVAMLRAKRGLKSEGGSTICGVINKKSVRTVTVDTGKKLVTRTVVRRQFSGIKGASEHKEMRAWVKAWANALDVLEGRFVPDGDLRYATHYIEPTSASAEGRCWFKRNLIAINWEGNHLFYREPTQKEKEILKSVSADAECTNKQLVASR